MFHMPVNILHILLRRRVTIESVYL